MILFCVLFSTFLAWGIWENEKNQNCFTTYRWRVPFHIERLSKRIEMKRFLEADWINWKRYQLTLDEFKKAMKAQRMFGGSAMIINELEEFEIGPIASHHTDIVDSFAMAVMGLPKEGIEKWVE